MNKKEFKKATNECFVEYGFELIDSKLFMELRNIILEISIDKTSYGDEYYYIHVYAWIKELHPNFNYQKLPKDYDTVIGMRFSINKNKAFMIYYLEFDVENYKKTLIPLINKHIDPIKNNEIEYLKKIGVCFSSKAKELLGIKD